MEAVAGLAGLVLCGGKSRRMGTDKALLPFEGEPLVLRVARRLGRAASPVLLAPGIRGRLGDLGYDEVGDEAKDAGALGGLVAGLAASPYPLLAVVAVDMPFVSPEVVGLLARRVSDDDAAIPATKGGLEPLHAVYSVRALHALRAALDARQLGLREVVAERLRLRVLPESEWRTADPSGGFALNLNRPEDLDEIWRRADQLAHTTAIEKEER
jgi:molybdopterin-guanine dinucleotide biosynthesis protein A